jgi:hypothetical protein
MSEPSSLPDQSPALPRPQNGKERLLVFIVAFLGLLIVAGLAAVVLRIIYLSANPPPQATTPASVSELAAVAPAAGAALRLALPSGAEVKSLSLSGDRLAVHFEGPAGAGILVVDVRSGGIVRQFELFSATRGP